MYVSDYLNEKGFIVEIYFTFLFKNELFHVSRSYYHVGY